MKNKNENVLSKFSGAIAGNFLKRYGGILIVLAVFVLLFSVVTDTFLTPNNLTLIVRQASTSCLIAFGITCVLICGSMDLSVGSIYGLGGMLAAWLLIEAEMPLLPVFLIIALLGILLGVTNAFVITKIRIVPFIATLGVSYVARGAAYLITGGTGISIMDETLNAIGMGTVLGIPITIFYALAVMLVLGIFMSRTRTGRYIYARGSNPTAAKFAGIKTDRMLFIVHSIAGVLAALAGLINSCRLFSATPGMGSGSEIDAIAAVVIGGTSMGGGSGSLTGTLIGALIISVMTNGMNHIGMNSYWQQVVKGLLIVIAVGLDGFKRQMEIKRMMQASAANK